MGGAARKADALLWSNGGRTVLLRLAAPAAVGAQGEELGLAAPGFQDVALGPVVFRKVVSATKKMLVSASAVKALVGSLSFDSADVLFRTAVGVVVDGVVWVIEACEVVEAGGEVCCYVLTLRGPVGCV